MDQRLTLETVPLSYFWAKSVPGIDFHVPQLRDVKGRAEMKGADGDDLRDYGRACALALARAHARSGDRAMIAGYLGASEVFDEAVADFSVAYADQVTKDYRTFVKAIRQGRLEAIQKD